MNIILISVTLRYNNYNNNFNYMRKDRLTDFQRRYISLYGRFNGVTYIVDRIGATIGKVLYYNNIVLKNEPFVRTGRPSFRHKVYNEVLIKNELRALKRCYKMYPSFTESAIKRIEFLTGILNKISHEFKQHH